MVKKLLALTALPKSWTEMSDAEQRDWCRALVETMRRNMDAAAPEECEQSPET
jgi:hypothetical protein